jgi:hypothetical protein
MKHSGHHLIAEQYLSFQTFLYTTQWTLLKFWSKYSNNNNSLFIHL